MNGGGDHSVLKDLVGRERRLDCYGHGEVCPAFGNWYSM